MVSWELHKLFFSNKTLKTIFWIFNHILSSLLVKWPESNFRCVTFYLCSFMPTYITIALFSLLTSYVSDKAILLKRNTCHLEHLFAAFYFSLNGIWREYFLFLLDIFAANNIRNILILKLPSLKRKKKLLSNHLTLLLIHIWTKVNPRDFHKSKSIKRSNC